jgi:hypothetical protein
MKTRNEINKYIICCLILILPSIFFFYSKFQESKRCKEERDNRNLEVLMYGKKFTIDTSVTNNIKAYDIFFTFILKNRAIIFENINKNFENIGKKFIHDSYLFYNVDDFPIKIRKQAIQLYNDCHLKNVYFTILKSNPYIKIRIEKIAYKGSYCNFCPVIEVFDGKIPVNYVRGKHFILNNHILYKFELSCDYIEDCD